MITINATLTKNELKILTKIFNFTQGQVKHFMAQYLRTKYSKVYNKKEFVVAKGDIPIALVAHLDTVHADKSSKEIYYDSTKGVLWSPDGLGADDRAGIFSIIQILEKGYRPTVILTTDEEIGALGAVALIEAFPKPITKLKYIIELDRRGSYDCVFYDCENPEFSEYVETFGFLTEWGSFSDISEICPAWGIAGVNLSIGYQNEHTKYELLRVSWMKSTIKKVCKMLDDAETAKSYEFIYSDRYWAYYNPNYEGYMTSGFNSEYIRCDKCKKFHAEIDIVSIRDKKGDLKHYCIDCMAGGIGWCDVCGDMYEIYTGYTEKNLCPICKAKGKKAGDKK